jgi:UDP-3-O-[3-hydroxymyristoyl] N-acetylglucosamine deacetylase
MPFQTSVKNRMSCVGVGVHTGAHVEMTLAPAPADSGIRFRRVDITDRPNLIHASFDSVSQTGYGTVIANDAGVSVSTIEHLMAALAGLGVDNAVIEIDGPEVPIMDGSAAPFVFLIECAGIKSLPKPRKTLRVLEKVEVVDGDKKVGLYPADRFSITYEIDFDADAIGRQFRALEITESSFKTQIARARTFGFLHEVEYLNKRGLARGASLDNAVVLSDGKVLNRGGVRFGDEFVRHKILDAVGDLALAGMPILGAYRAVRGGHTLNNQLLRALYDRPDAFEIVARGEAMEPHYMPSSYEGLQVAVA